MRLTTFCASVLSFAGVCFASQSVATVTSEGVIGLSGVRLEAGTVPSWPLVVGDEITTFESSALIVFSDKSRVLLDQKTTAKIGMQNGKMVLNMMKGAALGLRQNPQPVVLAGGRRVDLLQARTPLLNSDGFGRAHKQENQPNLPGAPAKPPSLSASKP